MIKITRGDWRAEPDGLGFYRVVTSELDGEGVEIEVAREVISEGDARLIAMAPRLMMDRERLADLLMRTLIPVRSWRAWVQNTEHAKDLEAEIQAAVVKLTNET